MGLDAVSTNILLGKALAVWTKTKFIELILKKISLDV